MSVKPVAWLYSRRHLNDAKGDVVTLNPASPLIAYGWTETPLYSAPAPELAEALQRMVELVRAEIKVAQDEGVPYDLLPEALLDSETLLARITPK